MLFWPVRIMWWTQFQFVVRGPVILSSTSNCTRHILSFNVTIIIWKNKPTQKETYRVQIKHSEHALICFPDVFFTSESCDPSSFALYRCLWMLSCDQIPHWDADEGPTCFKLRLWLWRQPPELFVLLSVISAHHLEQRLTGSPPFHKQLHSQCSLALLWCVYLY